MSDLFVYESGPGDTPTVVFLHGAGLSGRMWQPQFERLPDLHCLAPDLPEHGASLDAGPFRLQEAARLVADVVRRRATGGRAHVVGLSLGGAVAQALMLAAPDVVDHVILSGTSTRLSRVLIALQALNVPVLRFTSPERRVALLARSFQIPPQYLDLLREDMARFTAAAFGRVNRSYGEIEVPRRTESPTLVLVGEKETGIAKSAARRLSREIPGARGAMVAGVGHVWNLQAPDLFAVTVRAWIADRPLPPELRPLS
ncbi:MAG: alpha/beta fold hydrolase [Chloroflexota bacterium]